MTPSLARFFFNQIHPTQVFFLGMVLFIVGGGQVAEKLFVRTNAGLCCERKKNHFFVPARTHAACGTGK
jgi:hypothetical protein